MKVILKLCAALVVVALCTLTSGCALFQPATVVSNSGNGDYHYKYSKAKDGTVTCTADVDSGRVVADATVTGCNVENGSFSFQAKGLQQGADRSPDPLALLRAGQQLMLGQPVTIPAPVVVTPAPAAPAPATPAPAATPAPHG